jgi:uncharacterized protein YjbI with pentapeptide repeats
VNDDLDDADKELLKDMLAFNRAHAAAGWHIQDRVVTEDLSHIVLLGSSMTSIVFLNVNWRSARLSDTQFTNVEFEQAQFTEATLRGVVFKDCKFVLCSFAKATLTDCQFSNCTSEDLNARDATFEGCMFQSFADNSGVYGSATLRKCAFERCRLDNSSFYSAKFNTVSLTQAALKNVVFADIQGTGLSFENAMIHNCSFEGSRYGTLTFQGGQSKGITFKAFNPESLTLRNCVKIEALNIRESTGTGTAILDCPVISELTIDHSKMKDLTLERNEIAYFEMKETEVSGNSHITGCAISGLNLERSTLIGMQMTNCTVSNYLIADGATLDRVVLDGVAYAPGLTVSTAGVKYLNGSGVFGSQ